MKLSKWQLIISFCCFCSVLVPYTETNLESLNGRRILTVGLLTVKIVNKIQLRLILYFELFDLENFRLGSQKLHLTPPPFLTTGNTFAFGKTRLTFFDIGSKIWRSCWVCINLNILKWRLSHDWKELSDWFKKRTFSKFTKPQIMQ